MNEKLLQYIWKYQQFNKNNLTLTSGEEVQVLQQGMYNTNQGADFLKASIKINNLKLVGNIELHIKTSDFIKHGHQTNAHYQSLILHVVWEHDKTIEQHFPNPIATLELKGRIPKHLLEKYEDLMHYENKIACKNYLPVLSHLGWLSYKERLAAERLQTKATEVLKLFESNKHNWEETFWQQLAYNFGLTQNHELFLQTAQIVSHTLLAKNRKSIVSIEALLFGTANLLPKTTPNKYVEVLQKEYAFLQKKYKLQQSVLKPIFLRMRPANFPTIRMAQLAMLVYNSHHLFSLIKETETVEQVQNLFKLAANDYWNNHYSCTDEEHDFKPKYLGMTTINSLIINTVAPILFAYAIYNKQEAFSNKVLNWLSELPAEKNNLTNLWKDYEIENKNALHSQALIQLTKQYCIPKKCLQCAVGNKVLKM